jgi:hypothetical protein
MIFSLSRGNSAFGRSGGLSGGRSWKYAAHLSRVFCLTRAPQDAETVSSKSSKDHPGGGACRNWIPQFFKTDACSSACI